MIEIVGAFWAAAIVAAAGWFLSWPVNFQVGWALIAYGVVCISWELWRTI